MGPALPAGGKGGRFRQRKISTKQTLQILKQSQLSDIDNADLQQRDLQEIETGVDKNEEDEEHLQKILKKSGISSTANEYIPTPDASKLWQEAQKFYTGTFKGPDSYIKSSCQVEDYSGCLYNMDEEDDEFLKEYNKTKNKKRGKINEDEFESVMCALEQFINEKQPFLITDPTQLMSFAEIKTELKTTDTTSAENIRKTLEKELEVYPFTTSLDPKNAPKIRPISELFDKYGEDIYQHYKKRKIARHGKTIHPSLKFNQEDDSDPYSCFRQRQFRQQRKTRRADTQSSEKLVKLFLELKATQVLSFMVADREKKRLLAIQAEHEIFELRCKVKKMKRELGIKDSDEDLVTHKKRKVVITPPVPPLPEPKDKEEKKDRKVLSKVSVNTANQDKSTVKPNSVINDDSAGPEQPQQQTFQPYVKLPPSKIPDLDLESVTQILEVKHTNVNNYVAERMKKRKLVDTGFTNATDDPNSPYLDLALYVQNVVNPEQLPYSSIASSLSEVKSYGYISNMKNYIEHGVTQNNNDILLFNLLNREITTNQTPETYNPFYSENVSTSEPKYTIRKRVSRYGQTFVDRKYMVRRPASLAHDRIHSASMSDIDVIQKDLSVLDEKNRFEDRWRYDRDDGVTGTDISNISEDPARLNKISNETQIIRFGGMLLTKAYDSMKDVYNAKFKRQRPFQKFPKGDLNDNQKKDDSDFKSQSPLPNEHFKNNDNNDNNNKTLDETKANTEIKSEC